MKLLMIALLLLSAAEPVDPSPAQPPSVEDAVVIIEDAPSVPTLPIVSGHTCPAGLRPGNLAAGEPPCIAPPSPPCQPGFIPDPLFLAGPCRPVHIPICPIHPLIACE